MISIRQLQSDESAPMELLLLADPSTEEIQQNLDKGNCFVAIQDGCVVGASILVQTASHTMEIMDIAVKEEMQNQGIGKQLIAHAKETASKAGMTFLEIGTGNPGVQQMLLYQKCGFRIVGVDLDYFRRNHQEKIIENGIECRDMIRMQMELVAQ